MFQCNHGKIGDKGSQCISTEQRCDGVTDCTITITDCSQNFVGDVSSRCLAHTVDAGVQCNIGR